MAHTSTLALSCPPMYCGGLVHFKLLVTFKFAAFAGMAGS
jgi:hypothetical protein